MKLDGHGFRGAHQHSGTGVSRAAGGTADAVPDSFGGYSRSSRRTRFSRRSAPQLLAFLRGHAIGPLALIPVGLDDPVANGGGRRFEFARQLLGRPAGPHELDHPAPKLRWIRWTCSGHLWTSPPPQGNSVHETGSTPRGRRRPGRIHQDGTPAGQGQGGRRPQGGHGPGAGSEPAGSGVGHEDPTHPKATQPYSGVVFDFFQHDRPSEDYPWVIFYVYIMNQSDCVCMVPKAQPQSKPQRCKLRRISGPKRGQVPEESRAAPRYWR